MTKFWKIILIFSILLNIYFVAHKNDKSSVAMSDSSITSPTPSSSPQVKSEKKSHREILKEEIEQTLASLGDCKTDTSTIGMGQCGVKQIEYLESEITKVEVELKRIEKNASSTNFTFNSTYKEPLKKLMAAQVQDVLNAHAALKKYADARCRYAWYDFIGGSWASLNSTYCKVGLYKDWLIQLKDSGAYRNPDLYLYPESIRFFMENPTSSNWQEIDKAADAGELGPKNSIYVQLLEYDDAALHRDLPNSMSLKGITPNEFVRQQEARTDASFALIRKQSNDEFWRLLEVMASQNFDDHLVVTAGELAVRLDPGRFYAFAAKAIQANPDGAWMLERRAEILEVSYVKNDIEKIMECKDDASLSPTQRIHRLVDLGLIPNKPLVTIDKMPLFIPLKRTTFYGLPVLLVKITSDPFNQRGVDTPPPSSVSIYVSEKEDEVKSTLQVGKKENFDVMTDTAKWDPAPPKGWPSNEAMTIISCGSND